MGEHISHVRQAEYIQIDDHDLTMALPANLHSPEKIRQLVKLVKLDVFTGHFHS